MENEKTKDVGLRIPADVHEKLKMSASRNRRSVNNEIIVALELFFEKEEENKKEKLAKLLTDEEKTLLEKIKNLPLEKKQEFLK